MIEYFRFKEILEEIKERHENEFYNKEDVSDFIQQKINEQQEEIDKFEKHMEGECNANT
jgi:predicted nucleotidyltransferase